jgi:hypothetical protein
MFLFHPQDTNLPPGWQVGILITVTASFSEFILLNLSRFCPGNL